MCIDKLLAGGDRGGTKTQNPRRIPLNFRYHPTDNPKLFITFTV
jgi:hypothetical protein